MSFAQCVLMLTKMSVSTHPGRMNLRRLRKVTHISKLVCEYSARRSLDPVLVLSVIRVESGFDPHSVSSTHDYGLMQLNSKSRIGPTLYPGLKKCDLLRMRCNIKWGTYVLYLWKRKCRGRHHWLRHYNWYGAQGKYYLKVLWVRAAYNAAWNGSLEAYRMIRAREFPKKIRTCLQRSDLCIR